MSQLRRLDQWIASTGYGSRRDAQALILQGKVTIDGEIATRVDVRVNAESIQVRGKALEAPHGLLAIFHKPLGCVCTRSADEGTNVFEYLPARWSERNPAVTTVGRLDKDTSGLLLITDRGDLVQRWTSPRFKVEKCYEVVVDRALSEDLIAVFAAGDLLLRNEKQPCLPARLEIVGELQAKLYLTEGRYHQVRRMFASQGYHVEQLHRSTFGDYHLDGIAVGEWKLLNLP